MFQHVKCYYKYIKLQHYNLILYIYISDEILIKFKSY